MKIIAVNNPNLSNPPDVALQYWDNDISQWASNPNNGWIYISYNDPAHLITQLKQQHQISAEEIAELEILAHGDPENCNGINTKNVRNFSIQLAQANILAQEANLILTGCNTGLSINIFSLPKIMAVFTKRNVLATKGYIIRGSYAQNNVVCRSENPNTPGVPGMPGSTNEQGIYSYITFNSAV